MLDLCAISNKAVKTDRRAILCDSCERCIHIGCNDISLSVYENLKSKSDLWNCLVCIIRNILDSIPFTSCDDTELININSTNSMRFLESLPNLEIATETNSFSEFSLNDISKELPSKTSCKYYSVDEYQRLNTKMNLNIFHSNINGLGSKIDNLHEFLSRTSTKIDILAITETSEKEYSGFLSNVEIEGYEKYHTASKSAKNGTAIYVFKNLDKISNLEFETTWIKIKNKKQ